VIGYDQPVILEQRVVAFIDILGFRDLVRRMNTEPDLPQRVHHALLGIRLKEDGIYEDEDHRVEMTSFSDSSVFSAPEGHETEILSRLTYLSRDLMTNGVICRGAVVLGKAHHRERILFGPAIVAAYEAELHVAKYPRIFVADEVKARVQAADANPARRYHPARALVRDTDGCWFLDAFVGIMGADPQGKEVTFQRMGASIRSGLHRAMQAHQLDIVAKHRWLAGRFNLTVKRHYEGIVPSIDIDESGVA
jgi:hypothetical protein